MNRLFLIKSSQRVSAVVLALFVAAGCMMITNNDSAKAAGADTHYKALVNKIKRSSREVYYHVSDIDRDGRKELLLSNKGKEGSGYTLRIYTKRKGKIKKILHTVGYDSDVFVYKKGKIIVTYMCSHANEMYGYFKKTKHRYKQIGYKSRITLKAGGWDNTPWEYYYLDNLVGRKYFNKKVGKKAKGKRRVYHVNKWKNWENY